MPPAAAATPAGDRDIGWTAADVAAAAALLALAAALRLFFFTGLSGSDDTVYTIRGLETWRGLWLPSDYAGDLRYGVNLPIAGFVSLFGPGLAGIHTWALLCSLGEIAVIFLVALRLWGRSAAVLAALAIAVTPLHIHAGGRALADAPLAFFISLSFASFLFAERTGRAWLYGLTGLAIGFTWWIKPHAIVFAGAFGIYVLLARKWRWQWLLIMAGCASAIGMEFALFAAKFGDPFYALKSMVHGIDRNFVRQDAPWGDHAAFYYFRQMFLDGRDMGMVPLLSAAAAVAIVARRHERSLTAGRYALFWGLALLCIFSFMPYTLSPFKLIPKQDNYALMFFGPVGLLAGYGLTLIRPLPVRGIAIAAAIVTSVTLAALPQHQVHTKLALLDVPTSYVRAHPEMTVYVPEHAINLMRVSQLQVGQSESSPNAHRLGEVLTAGAAPVRPAGDAIVFLHPAWPEVVKSGSLDAAVRAFGCLEPIEDMPVRVSGFGVRVVAAIDALRARLPGLIARHLAFTDRLHEPPPVRVFRWAAQCNRSVASQ
jgi:4-amino-4-deoxy-L-arabinose transferase-like glycosyltransferase